MAVPAGALHRQLSGRTEHDFAGLMAENGPMGESLRNPAYFARVFLEDGAPTWPNGFDACLDWLRQELEAGGKLSHDAEA